MANLGPMVGNAAHFKFYAPFLAEDKAAIAYGDQRYSGEAPCGSKGKRYAYGLA
jgi:hypothetical protein